ncbi:unnamed protein product [Symbiodinium sp. CCMP2592]|nr:unnamed protein product [Symbiodinium sp. CCMP2592]
MFIEGLSKDAGDDLLSKVYTRLSDYQALPRNKDAILGDLLRAHRACESYGGSAALGGAELVLVSMMAEVWRCDWLSQPTTSAVLIGPLDATLRRHGLSEEAAMRLTYGILAHIAPPVHNHHADEWATSDSDASPAVEDSSLADDGATTREATSTALQHTADEGSTGAGHFGSWKRAVEATSTRLPQTADEASTGVGCLRSCERAAEATSTTLRQAADESTGVGYAQTAEDRPTLWPAGDRTVQEHSDPYWETCYQSAPEHSDPYWETCYQSAPTHACGLPAVTLLPSACSQMWTAPSGTASMVAEPLETWQSALQGQQWPFLPMSEMDSLYSSVQSSFAFSQVQAPWGQLHLAQSQPQAVEGFFPLSSCSGIPGRYLGGFDSGPVDRASPASTTPGCSDPAAKGNLPRGGEHHGESDTVTATTVAETASETTQDDVLLSVQETTRWADEEDHDLGLDLTEFNQAFLGRCAP